MVDYKLVEMQQWWSVDERHLRTFYDIRTLGLVPDSLEVEG